MAVKYLYRERNSTSTCRSLEAFKRWQDRGFVPDKVVLRHQGGGWGARTVVHGVIKGERAALLLRGLTWGYSGEGPRGLAEVLKAVGVCGQKAFSYSIAGGNNYYSEEPFRVEVNQ